MRALLENMTFYDLMTETMFQVGRKEKSCLCFIHDMDNCFFMCVCVGGGGYGCIRAGAFVH